LEAGGYLVSERQVVGGKVRKYYRATEAGRQALIQLRPRIRELVNEVLEEDDSSHAEESTEEGRE
jgi:DNA-binding PadR family transcriptional regulator